MSTGKTYEDGLQAGEIAALKQITEKHDIRLDAHATRLQRIERVLYALAGVAVLLEFLPEIRGALGG